MAWIAYLLVQTGKIHFIEFKGTCSVPPSWLSQDQARGFLLRYTHPPTPRAPCTTPTPWHAMVKNARLVCTAVPSWGLLTPSSLLQQLSLRTTVSEETAPMCYKRAVRQKICFLKLRVPETPSAQICLWFTTTPSIIIASRLSVTGSYTPTGTEDSSWERRIPT